MILALPISQCIARPKVASWICILITWRRVASLALAIILMAAACFAGLGTRLVWLHVVDRDAILRPVARARPMLIPEMARRGDIVDSRGKLELYADIGMLGIDKGTGPKLLE